MTTEDTYRAYSRFGLGVRPGDLAALPGDVQAAVAAEIADPATLLLDEGLPDTATAYTLVLLEQADDTVMQAAAARAAAANGGMAPDAKPSPPPSPNDLLMAEVDARLDRAKRVGIGFGERLVAFWTNHFAVQMDVGAGVKGLAGAFEREAIRPNVLGKFGDLLLAATRHPAMLISLSNVDSIGPGSPRGKASSKGLNENHARELMELHSIGVNGGYTQADVTSFAKVLTGWTFGRSIRQPEQFGRFTFVPQAHEPGPQTIMGQVYAQPGVDQGEAVIAALAASPATAQHIALKLARHFVADTPDPALVALLADTFTGTGGDLKAVTLALVKAPAAWSAPAEKLSTPQEFLWSAVRSLALDIKPEFVVRMLEDLGQPLWNPPSPEGFKDDVATWLAPDAIVTRIDAAELLASQSKSTGNPLQLAEAVLGPVLSDETRATVGRAESRGQALAMLLMSPEFQRR